MRKKRLLNLWVTSPIDWWSGMIDLSKHSARDFAMSYDDNEPFEFEVAVHEMLSHARELALRHGWEGDTSQGPFLSAIPDGSQSADLIIAWKQSNNGTCFIASHVMLPGRDFDNPMPHQG